MSEKPTGDSFLSRHKRKLLGLAVLGAAELGREATQQPPNLPPDNSTSDEAAVVVAQNTTAEKPPVGFTISPPASPRPTEQPVAKLPVENKILPAQEKNIQSAADKSRADMLANLRPKFKDVKFSDWVKIPSSSRHIRYHSTAYPESESGPEQVDDDGLITGTDLVDISLRGEDDESYQYFVVSLAQEDLRNLVSPVTFDDPRDLEVMVQKFLDLARDPEFQQNIQNYRRDPSPATISVVNNYLAGKGLFGSLEQK